ncbi:Imidazoleglycerol-phosphate dehydratase [archaeon HR01]|nr:Imidazoleglycerol-phosphate dehydratase [archaeon HR01]
MRLSRVERKTGETEIVAELNLDGSGISEVSTGYRFLDHMVMTLSKHSLIDIKLRAVGDLRHHTVEDCGITIGQGISKALSDRAGIRRYGYSIVPMDEAVAYAAVDLVKRPKSVVRFGARGNVIEDTPISEIAHFLDSLIISMEATAHVKALAGLDDHHRVEACIKAFALALRMAVEPDPRRSGIPSTKGMM